MSTRNASSPEAVPEPTRRERDKEQLRQLVLEGVASPQAAVADKSYFDDLRARVHRGEFD